MILNHAKYHLIITKPPSVNTLYGFTRRGFKYITKKGKDWFEENLWEIKRQLPNVRTIKRSQITIRLKTIQLDIDNVLKGALDLLTKGTVIEDDQYIMKLIITKELVHRRKDEGLDIIIEELHETPSI